MASLNENIKRLRIKNRMTLSEVGEKIGVKNATVQRYESGAIKTMKTETIVKLAAVFGVAPSELMGWEDEGDAAPARRTRARQPLEKVLEKSTLTYRGVALNEEDRERVKKALALILWDIEKRATRKENAAAQGSVGTEAATQTEPTDTAAAHASLTRAPWRECPHHRQTSSALQAVAG